MFGCCQRFRELLLEMPPKRVFRESKGAEEEEYLDNVQSLETIVVNMSAKSSSFCLIKFFEEVCKENGVYYPPRGLQSICSATEEGEFTIFLSFATRYPPKINEYS